MQSRLYLCCEENEGAPAHADAPCCNECILIVTSIILLWSVNHVVQSEELAVDVKFVAVAELIFVVVIL